ncbi:MAG: hypothetical protein H0U75_07215 [Legionella sp.]|nr:hypothetical protein [Legionella sp.]
MEKNIAIIGSAFSLPGASNFKEFETMTFSGSDAFCFPKYRLNKGENWIDRAGYLTNWSMFDYRLYGLSLRDSLIIDPQHRLFIQHCWKAIENSGYNPKALPDYVGVFSTASDTDYANLVKQDANFSNQYNPFEIEIGSNKEQQALRVSYLLNLKGPSYNVQSACSSGLLVIHTAMQALSLHDCDLALAGGACFPMPLYTGYEYKEGMNLSKTGTISSFDRRADGMVPGFGSVVFVLKRLADAIRDRDSILAVLLASSVNNDGYVKSSYTSPSSSSISENLMQLLKKANLNPAEIDLVEAHGSGTHIGDVIEAAALRKVFPATKGSDFCTAVSSVKSSIGHLDTVAGLAGLLRTVIQVKRQAIAPAANFKQLNHNISFEQTSLYIPTTETVLNRNMIGVVNSLGIGGTNCAILVQSAPPHLRSMDTVNNEIIFYIGAESRQRLQMLKKTAGAKIVESAADMRDIAFTFTRRALKKPYLCKCMIQIRSKEIVQLELIKKFDTTLDKDLLVTKNSDGIALDLEVSEIDPASFVELPIGLEESSISKDTNSAAQILRSIWQKTLLISEFNDLTSFHDEGGHSLSALSLLDEINKGFNIKFDLDWVYQHDRFRQQLESIRLSMLKNTNSQSVKLIRRPKVKAKQKMIFVHASLSGYEPYKPLAGLIDPNVEIIGIDSYNLYAEKQDIIYDMDGLVDLYISDIEKFLPDHSVPLLLGGWSLGGMIAHKMAEKLSLKYKISGLVGIDSIIFQQHYALLFEDSSLNYFMNENLTILTCEDNRLSEIFHAERKMARIFSRVINDVPFLNIIATKSRLEITNQGLISAFSLAKIDNGWGKSEFDKILYIDADHMQIVSETNMAMIAQHINQFMRQSCITM